MYWIEVMCLVSGSIWPREDQNSVPLALSQADSPFSIPKGPSGAISRMSATQVQLVHGPPRPRRIEIQDIG